MTHTDTDSIEHAVADAEVPCWVKTRSDHHFFSPGVQYSVV